MTPERDVLIETRIVDSEALLRRTEEVRRSVMDTVAQSRATRASIRMMRQGRMKAEAHDA